MPNKRGLNQHLVPANVYIAGHRTSLKMEPELWECLRQICDRTKLTTDQLVSFLAHQHPGSNLPSLIRSYVANLLLERLEQSFKLTPLRLSQYKGIRRLNGVIHLIEADEAKAS